MKVVELVDIGGGNTGSVKRCLEMMGLDYLLKEAANKPSGDNPLILPGVGAFGAVMRFLRENRLDDYIRDLVLSGTPYLGICVGMQILFETSQEAPGAAGLALLAGSVCRFNEGKVPQIGWNLIERTNWQETAAETSERTTFPQSGYVYFVNSYYARPELPQSVLYASSYHADFCAAVDYGNITGFQFHPEKSGSFGKLLLQRWWENVD